MTTSFRKAWMLVAALTMAPLPATAGNRVRAGQWLTTLNVGGHVITRPVCLSQSDADAINGDASSIRGYVEKLAAPQGCKVTDVRIHGDQVSVTEICASGRENVGTTTYHGDSYETSNTNGTKAQSKWIGPCK